MQLRCLHADGATFAVRDHDPAGEDGPTVDVAGSIVALVAAEAGDSDDISGVADAAADHVSGMADHLGEQTVVLVPFADLTDTPAPEATTTAALDALAARLDGDVHRVPVGDHVAVDLQARGHPHASQAFAVAPAERTDGEWSVFEDGDLTAGDGHDLLVDGRLVDRLSDDRLFPDTGPPLADRTLLPLGTFLRDSVLDFAADRLRSGGALAAGGTDGPEPLAGSVPLFTMDADPPELAAARPADALETLGHHLDTVLDLLAALELEPRPVCRLDPPFFDDHRDAVTDLVGGVDGTTLVDRRTDAQTPIRLELPVCAEGHRLVEPAVWLDATAEQPVVRAQPLGDPIRLVAAVARRGADRDPPQLPTWLSPTQLRLIPLTDDDTDRCVAIAEDLAGVRVDIDDRDLPVSDRLEDASQGWIPYDAVVGEGDEERFGVTVRAAGRERAFTADSFVQAIDCETAGAPDRPRPLPMRYTDCPARFRDR